VCAGARLAYVLKKYRHAKPFQRPWNNIIHGEIGKALGGVVTTVQRVKAGMAGAGA
jgi:hypothetical protein